MGLNRFIRCAVAVLAFALLSAAPALAENTIELGLDRLAEAVAKSLKELSHSAVVVGDVQPSPRLQAAGGPGLKKTLVEKLAKHGITESPMAAVQLLPEFTTTFQKAETDATHNSAGLLFKAKLLDNRDEELVRFSIPIFGDDALAPANPTFDIHSSTPSQAEKIKDEAVQKPQAVVIGNEVRASSTSPYGVEVLVESGKKLVSRPPKLEAGRAFVDLADGEEYVVRLYNRDPDFEAAVTLTIDGLSMFNYTQEGNNNAQVLVPKNSFIDIPGWYFTQKESLAFLISSYPDEDDKIKTHPARGSLGAITATFSYAFDPNASTPPDEPQTKSANKKLTETGRKIGREYVKVPRKIGKVRASVSVRYDR